MADTRTAFLHAHECEVRRNENVARATQLLTMRAPESVFEAFSPGRFCDVAVPHARQMLLRRPFSIYTADAEAGEISILFAAVGAGTEELARVVPGEILNVLMPLGHGFDVPDTAKTIWLVGGGLGVGALGSVAPAYPDRTFVGFFGFRSADRIPDKRCLPQGLSASCVATEDGSSAQKGFVTDLVADAARDRAPDLILACGPSGMYQALRQLAGDSVPVQVSVEERMGCGTGGCETCVCRVRGRYLKSCTDGPVFNLDEVDEYADRH